jgi:predicted regulator of Ras-like GTPase activity (Roadblock/LC7/MglB family)
MENTHESGMGRLNQILAQMNQDGGYSISTLTDENGLVIAFATDQEMDPERHSAVVSFMQSASARASHQVGLGETDEIALSDRDARRLVCRPFVIDDYHLILSVFVTQRDQAYRRISNHAISRVKKLWRIFRK